MKIEMIKVGDLRPAKYNPRTMPDSEMQALKNSLEKNGFVEPLVVNRHQGRENILIGGHQRLTAAKELGMKEVPVFYVNLNEQAEKALNLSLNKIRGQWDEKKLALIIYDIKASDLLPSTGFRDDEASSLLDTLINPEEELEGPEKLPEEPTSVRGQVYELGPHKLLCGDATQPESYEKLLGKEQADMIWTDPPYNVNYHSRAEKLKEQGKEKIENDNLTPEQFKELIESSMRNLLYFAKAGAVFYICSGWSSYPDFLRALTKASGYVLSGVIVWVKNVASMGWNDYRYKHEYVMKAKKQKGRKKATSIIYGWKEGGHKFYGGRDEYDVWEMPRKPANKYLHPTEKPVWLPMRAIRNSSKRDAIILDCFAGSGSVMEAAEKTGRKAYMIEFDPRFCDVIRNRYERMKDKK